MRKYRNKTRWSLIFEPNDCTDCLFIANRQIGDQLTDISFYLKLFNSFGDEPLTAQLDLGSIESVTKKVHDIFEDMKDYLDGSPGWIYLTSKEKHHAVVHYVSVKKSDSIACCHAF